MTTPADSVASPPSRFRFTLRTVLLACALVAVGMALWLSYRQTRRNELLRQENARLRNELGEILIEPGDENKLHAVGVPTAESMLWKWRIFVPTGRTFYLYTAAEELSGAGEAPKNYSKTSLSPGEQTLMLMLRKDYRNQWTWYMKTPQGSSEFSADGPELAKSLDVGNFGTASTGMSALTKVEPGQDLQLFRLRILPRPPNGSIESSQVKTPGQGVELRISEQ